MTEPLKTEQTEQPTPETQPEAAPAQQATTSVPDAGPAPANPAGIRF